jgi:gluconolactonase
MKLAIFFIALIIIQFEVISQSSYNYQESDWQVVAEGCDFPEGPAYDGKGNLYFSNCYGSWIGKYDGKTSTKFLSKNDSDFTISKTNGLTFGNDGFLYACDYGIGVILKISVDGKSEILVDGFKGEKFNRPNDLAFAKNGKLYFTDPKSYDSKILDGRIFEIDINTKLTRLIYDGLAFPNGIAFNTEGNLLYVCESAKQRILKFNFVENNKLSELEEFVLLPGGDPDGIAFDQNGNLWVAHFGGKSVYVISPEGKIITQIPTPGKKPSNLEFGGIDYKTLFLTETETNKVYQLKVIVPGLKLIK